MPDEQEDVLDIPIGSIPQNIPKYLVTAIEYLVWQTAKEADLRCGLTALFWYLLAEVSHHMKEKEKYPCP